MRGKPIRKRLCPKSFPIILHTFEYLSMSVSVLFANKAEIKSSQPPVSGAETRHEIVQEWRSASAMGEVMIHDCVQTRKWLVAGASGHWHCWAPSQAAASGLLCAPLID